MDEQAVGVRDVRTVGDDAVALELETPDEFEALPGQFVRVLGRAEKDGDDPIARYYTLSSPTLEETFEITVAVDPDGDISPWLANRRAGDTVRIEGPFGDVAYDDEGDVLVLAGGPGVGPALGIGERALDRGHAVTIVYRDEIPIHQDRLGALSNAGAAVRVLGPDDDLDAAMPDDLAGIEPYVFGFQTFVETAMTALESVGVGPADAHVESFG
ncbi:MAG TPA: FAD-dependent oxidoreductase [Natrialbaceae archaeon]|nr:FAD-dependent oxidoreductase [Natrialbaceae archaeon]